MQKYRPIVKGKLKLENSIAAMIKTFEKKHNVIITSLNVIHASGTTTDFEDTVLITFKQSAL